MLHTSRDPTLITRNLGHYADHLAQQDEDDVKPFVLDYFCKVSQDIQRNPTWGEKVARETLGFFLDSCAKLSVHDARLEYLLHRKAVSLEI